VLSAYARYGSIGTLRSRAERLRYGTTTPLQPRYDVLKETGRTSCTQGDGPATWGFQIQNVHREPGLRECFVPRPGYVLCSCDWSSAEMHTVAQVCRWMGLPSRLADALNAGQDPHLVLAAAILGWSYERALAEKKSPEVKRARQMAKAGNFGFPGGMGAAAFQEYAAATYGVVLNGPEVALLKDRWFGRYPEFREYFAHVNAFVESGQPVEHFRSRRFRGGATYCATCNTFFQGLAADMAKDAAFNLAAGTYLGAGDLAGSRVVAFIHDEFLVEVPERTAHEAAKAVQLVMEEAGRAWCPDVPVRAEPALMRAWSKAAEPVYDGEGRLVPWEDRAV
jgi:DNA polymerase-1